MRDETQVKQTDGFSRKEKHRLVTSARGSSDPEDDGGGGTRKVTGVGRREKCPNHSSKVQREPNKLPNRGGSDLSSPVLELS